VLFLSTIEGADVQPIPVHFITPGNISQKNANAQSASFTSALYIFLRAPGEGTVATLFRALNPFYNGEKYWH
jgi:hypothetical protein